MKIKVEVSQAELESMYCDSIEEFKKQLHTQLNDGVVGDDGEAGIDWLAHYELEIIRV